MEVRGGSWLLVSGIALAIAGVMRLGARWIGIIAAAIGGLNAIRWMPFYPIWALTYIAICLFVISAWPPLASESPLPDRSP